MIWLNKKLQVMSYLVSLDNGMERRRLLNLIYMVDRKSYIERGCPIAGGRLFAMDSGPANYDIYDLMTNNHDEYFNYFENEGYQISLKSEPDYGKLSPYEEEKLLEIHKHFYHMDCWEIAHETQKFQEWQDCYDKEQIRNEPIWIPLEKMLMCAGFSEKYAKRIISETESHEKMCRLLTPDDCKGEAI